MNRSIGALILIASLAGCTQTPVSTATLQDEAALPQVKHSPREGTSNEGESDAPYELNYESPRGKGFRKLVIRLDGKAVATLDSKEWVFDGLSTLSEGISPNRSMTWVSMVASGDAIDDDGNSHPYERAYCTFISLPEGCVLGSGTGSECGGQWEGDSWRTPDGELQDYRSRAITARKVLSGDGFYPISRTMDNLLRCDPPSKENAADYLEVMRRNLISASPEQKRTVSQGAQ